MAIEASKKYDHIYSYDTAKGLKWFYRYQYKNYVGKRREKSKRGFNSEAEAYRAYLEVVTNVLDGDIKEVEYSNITVGEWLNIWFDSNKDEWAQSTVRQRHDAIKNKMIPLIGKYKLATLDKVTYKKMFIERLLTEKLSHTKSVHNRSTVQLYHNLFRIAVNAAVDAEILKRNRFLKIKIEVQKKKDNFLTNEQLQSFLKTAKEIENKTNYTLVLLLAFSGMRIGEAKGLQWSDIDFERNEISINRTRDEKGTRKPKTRRSIRTLKLDEAVMKQLKSYRTWCKATHLKFGIEFEVSNHVFISYQSGTKIGTPTVTYLFRRLCKKTGVDITPHGLRHTHATILISNGVDVITIADRLGNTPQMVLDVYAHTFEDLQLKSVDTFSSIISIEG
ncbi:tyrosine-type recombinase/integrase [Listeria booriae]|uniref:tyrosine-type recombinase/integrase n=1 Tax=Listeria booriae TaxID=1552123 RepID=UPI00162474BE|nr:tyrosine-type recombinase/integrase [Listeria booriae]MBC1983045.1 site-specific integrase [Listeria booriae]